MEPVYSEALARCVRVAAGLDPAPVNLPPGTGVERLIELASHHGLTPHLSASGIPVPDGWSQRWTRASLLLASEAARLTQSLEAAGIRAMPLKGPVLAHMLSGDPAGREYSDLDLMVEPGRGAAAAEVLRGQGYQSKWPPSAAERHARFNWYEELPLRHSRTGIDVDLHWSFTPRYYPAPIDDCAVWRRAIRVDFLGRPVEVPAPEDYLEYLCLHAARHEWSRLGWLADLVLFRMRFGGEIRVRDLVARSSGAQLVAEGLRRASEWIGLPHEDFGDAAPVSLWRELRYRAAILLIPTEADWAETDLPPGLDFFYYPLRLGRLVQRRLRRLD